MLAQARSLIEMMKAERVMEGEIASKMRFHVEIYILYHMIS